MLSEFLGTNNSNSEVLMISSTLETFRKFEFLYLLMLLMLTVSWQSSFIILAEPETFMCMLLRQDVFQIRDTPFHPEYSDFNRRLQTFRDVRRVGPSADQLASSGFYSIGGFVS